MNTDKTTRAYGAWSWVFKEKGYEFKLASWEHKRRRHEVLGRDWAVIASIGDSEEEEAAAAAVGMCFVKVDVCRPGEAWVVLEGRIAEVGGFGGGQS